MTWQTLIAPAFSGRLCLTLMHSIWQVSLLALVVWSIDRFWRKTSVERHYLLNVAALVTALAALPMTYQLLNIVEPVTQIAGESPALITEIKPQSAPLAVPPLYPEQVVSKATQYTEPLTQRPPEIQAPQATNALIVAPATVSPSTQWLWLAPWIMVIYAAGVALMLTRLIIASIRANRLGAHAVLVTAGPLVETLQSLAQQWSMKVVPALARAEQIVVPKVIGIIRPTILLPTSAISGLSTEELELILAHELAHVRRYDMWIYLLQRFAEAVLFFNPPLWYLSRRISTLREYCCDEMTCRVQPATDSASAFELRVQYATALLRVAELAKRSSVSTSDLASLAASGKSPSEMRRRVARLFGEPLREPLRVSRTGVLALLALVLALPLTSLVSTTTAQTETKKENTEKKPALQKTAPPTSNSSKGKEGSRTFQLNVVDPAGKPIPNALIEARTSPAITAEQIQRGEYVRKSTYGPYVKTDAKGVLQLTVPPRPGRFNFSIKQPGYGPYWASWSSSAHPETIPDEFTAQLEAAWTVGGIIVDESGKPIVGAKVSPSVKFKKRPGDNSEMGVGTRIITDAKGQWRYQHIPVSKPDVYIAVNHPDYRPWRDRVSRSEFEIKENQTAAARIVLNRGLAITGSVTDENGKPVPGALVRTKFMNDLRKTTTDEQGVYLLTGCEPRLTRVVVSAKGRAPEVQEVRVDPEMEPVDFVLKPGGKIRIRVVDEQGKGIPKARILFQRWRGSWIGFFEFNYVNQYADENGVWEWNEAPLDEFQADICRPGGMDLSSQTLIARDEEYVFTPPKMLAVSGRVVDAKTKQPIKKFLVTHGVRDSRPESRILWLTSDSFEARDGTYLIRIARDEPEHLIRLAAPGYRVAVSRKLKNTEGAVKLDFELEPAQDIATTILTPDGKPAADAKIAVGVENTQISIRNGDIRDSSTSVTLVRSNTAGHFNTPATSEPFQLVITHPAGFAHYKSDSGPLPDPLRLTPWARVVGQFRIGNKPAPKVYLTIQESIFLQSNENGPRLSTWTIKPTGPDGRYDFDRVFPGKGYLSRSLSHILFEGAREATSAIIVPLEFVAGKTIHLDLGRTGRPVIGKLVPPGIMALEELQKDPQKYLTWYKNWKASERYATEKASYEKYEAAHEKMRLESLRFCASVAPNGSFRIDDVPAGTYAMTVRFHSDNPKAHPSPGYLINHIFSVPPAEAKASTTPVDLGTLTLKK